jgi:integrase
VRVECQLGRDGTRTPLKTEEAQRAVDIPPQLMRRLLDLVAPRGLRFDADTLVFASRNGTGLERKVAREALRRAVKASGIAPPEPTLHDLRHSHASMLIAMDVPVVEVQRRLGHRKPDTTLRIYTHQWRYREAQRSRIGQQLAPLFAAPEPALPSPIERPRAPLALPAPQGA